MTSLRVAKSRTFTQRVLRISLKIVLVRPPQRPDAATNFQPSLGVGMNAGRLLTTKSRARKSEIDIRGQTRMQCGDRQETKWVLCPQVGQETKPSQ